MLLKKFGLNRENAKEIVDWVTGHPVQMQKQPVKWDSDYLNVFDIFPDEIVSEKAHNQRRGEGQPDSLGHSGGR